MTSTRHARQCIAQECARLIAEEGVSDYITAKYKAAYRLGYDCHGPLLPRNDEVDQALAEYHRLYRAPMQDTHINRLRTIAVDIMQRLHAFSPRLIGNVLTGHAGPFCPIILQLFAHAPEDVLITLIDANIPFTEQSHEIPSAKGKTTHGPSVHFLFDGTNIELQLFPHAFLYQRPKGRDHQPMSASIQTVRALIAKRTPSICAANSEPNQAVPLIGQKARID